jgi:catechol 2,3-dioxygenase-like lactoylglutathione lyase family enzyme
VAVPGPVGQLRTVVVDCLDPEPLATFWSALLGVDVHHRGANWISLRAAEHGHPRVAFQRVPEVKATKNRLHLDVWVADIAAATTEAEALGASRVGPLVTAAGEPFQVLADPAGNEFCLVHLPGSTGP